MDYLVSFLGLDGSIIGAFGVLDLDRLYIIPWSVRISRVSIGRLALPTYLVEAFLPLLMSRSISPPLPFVYFTFSR